MEKSKIDRINALAKKAKAIGLTERETAERDALRKEYLADMRAAFKQQLDSTYVQTADGAKIPSTRSSLSIDLPLQLRQRKHLNLVQNGYSILLTNMV